MGEGANDGLSLFLFDSVELKFTHVLRPKTASFVNFYLFFFLH